MDFNRRSALLAGTFVLTLLLFVVLAAFATLQYRYLDGGDDEPVG